MNHCCENCFTNRYIKEYIRGQREIGTCNYCNAESVYVISTKEIGTYIRECLDKAYENIDGGTGVMYDSEDNENYARNGEIATSYTIEEILIENEGVLDDNVVGSCLLQDIFEHSGPSEREKMQGACDKYEDIESTQFVISNDLYGQETTNMYCSWEIFKHTIKHYNRFFDIDGLDLRKEYLQSLRPYIMEYEGIIEKGTVFYRARKQDKKIPAFPNIDAYKELSPAPPKYAATNRMSPAGIPYLYLASDTQTAWTECRCKQENVLVAEYESIKELSIIDFSKKAFVNTESIFSEKYDHDLRWINQFLDNFISEITYPVDDDKKDHSYEYASTQLMAEYIRSLGYDGICFKSSVSQGMSYVFFCGPDEERDSNAYDFADEYIKYYLPLLTPFTEWFLIRELELYYISEDNRQNKLRSKIVI